MTDATSADEAPRGSTTARINLAGEVASLDDWRVTLVHPTGRRADVAPADVELDGDTIVVPGDAVEEYMSRYGDEETETCMVHVEPMDAATE